MPSTEPDAIALLKADHRKVEELFAGARNARDVSEKEALVHEICTELFIHSTIEEEMEAIEQPDMLDEAYVEHDGAKVLISELLNSQPSAGFYEAKLAVLEEMIKHHVEEEEKPEEGLFAQAEASDLDMTALAEELSARKEELMEEYKEGAELPPPETRSFTGHELVQGVPVESKSRVA